MRRKVYFSLATDYILFRFDFACLFSVFFFFVLKTKSYRNQKSFHFSFKDEINETLKKNLKFRGRIFTWSSRNKEKGKIYFFFNCRDICCNFCENKEGSFLQTWNDKTFAVQNNLQAAKNFLSHLSSCGYRIHHTFFINKAKNSLLDDAKNWVVRGC